VLIYGENGTGK
jgi:two-component system nitrogen regulation response regulator NtrX